MIPVIHADDDVLVVDKPAGVATIPGYDRRAPSLLERVAEQVGQRLFVVHRLDGPVSGVLLFARHAAAHRALSMAFEARRVEKTYLALAHGVIEPEHGVIEAPLRKFGSGRMGVDPRRGKASTTTFRVLERIGPYTLVEAHPVTGRRHQLRVHFYHLGHPLVGDPLYGDVDVQSRYPRLLLHAHRLQVPLPDGREPTFTAPLPADFRAVVEALRAEGA